MYVCAKEYATYPIFTFSAKFRELNFRTETSRVELWFIPDAKHSPPNIKFDKNRATN